MQNSTLLVSEAQKYIELQKRIKASEIDIDDTTLNDTLEGATNLYELIEEITRSALVDESFIEGIKEYQNKLKERVKRFSVRIAKKRELVLWVLQEVGIDRLERADFSVSLRSVPPKVLIDNEDMIPVNYKVIQPPKIDKSAICQALKEGVKIEGARLSETSNTVAVRIR